MYLHIRKLNMRSVFKMRGITENKTDCFSVDTTAKQLASRSRKKHTPISQKKKKEARLGRVAPCLGNMSASMGVLGDPQETGTLC